MHQAMRRESSLECLDAGLFIDAENGRSLRGVQVIVADDLCLGGEVRIGAMNPLLVAMRLDLERRQSATNLAPAHARSRLPQQYVCYRLLRPCDSLEPKRRRVGTAQHSDKTPGSYGDPRWASASRPILERLNPWTRSHPSPPHPNRLDIASDRARDFPVSVPSRRHQGDPRSLNQPLLRLATTEQQSQSTTHWRCEPNDRWSRPSHHRSDRGRRRFIQIRERFLEPSTRIKKGTTHHPAIAVEEERAEEQDLL